MLGFRLDLLCIDGSFMVDYFRQYAIAMKFKDIKWGAWQNVSLACLVCKNMLLPRGSDSMPPHPPEIESGSDFHITVHVSKCCDSAGHL